MAKTERQKVTWAEYEYRHEHIWKNVYKLTFSIGLLSVLPYLHRDVACVLEIWIIWAPGLAVSLGVFAVFRGWRELRGLKEIRILYREIQGTDKKLGKGWFTSHMMFYLCALLIAASVNAYVVYIKWIPATKVTGIGISCFADPSMTTK